MVNQFCAHSLARNAAYCSIISDFSIKRSGWSVETFIVWLCVVRWENMSLNLKKRTFRSVCPAKIQISLRIRAVWSESSLGAFWIAKAVKCLREDNEWSDCSNAQSDQSSLGAHVRRYVSPHCGSYIFSAHFSIIYSENRCIERFTILGWFSEFFSF